MIEQNHTISGYIISDRSLLLSLCIISQNCNYSIDNNIEGKTVFLIFEHFFFHITFVLLFMENAPIEAFKNQVGGHTFELQNQGMLHQGSWILKQLQDMGRGYKNY